MWRTSKSTRSQPAVNPTIISLMLSRPAMGSTGMLWYTASAWKYSIISSMSSFDQAAQKLVTTASGDVDTVVTSRSAVRVMRSTGGVPPASFADNLAIR